MNPPPITTARARRLHELDAGVVEHPRQELRAPLDPLADRPRVRHGPDLEDPGQVDAGQRRADRGRPGREHELVVGLGRHLAGRDVAQVHGLLLRRDARPPRSCVRASIANWLRKTARSPPGGSTPSGSRRRRGRAARSSRTRRTARFSTMRISAFSSSLRRRAAHDAPPATPPTMTTFMICLLFCRYLARLGPLRHAVGLRVTPLLPDYPTRRDAACSSVVAGSLAVVTFFHCSSSSSFAACSRNSGAAHFFTSKSFLM